MMSISRGMRAKQAGGYFSKEDYYLKDADREGVSRWHGRGADSFGLAGPVREEEFRALCSGRHPVTGEVIVSPRLCRDRKTGEVIEMHRAGNDCTFSAPKSVSVAYAAGVEGIKEAHDAAVASVVGHMEEHYTHYRSPEGARNGDLVAASFDHATSRNLDPQLHSHVFIMNAVRSSDGSWKANWHRPIFEDQKSLGLLYRQELARELRKRGFEIDIVDRAQVFIELTGVDPKLIAHFSTRREAIERQVALWKEEGKFPGVSDAKVYEMAALETRDPKREVTREEVERIFSEGFKACGTSLAEVKRELERARDLALEREPERQEYSAPQVVRLAAGRLIDREAVLDRARLMDQAVLISGGRHGSKELNAGIDGGAEGVLRLGQDLRGREYYTTVEMMRLEEHNLETIKSLEKFHSVTTLEEVRDYVVKVEERDGFSFTTGQKQQIENEYVGTCAVGVIDGKAGTGKTLATKVMEGFNAEVLRPQGKEHFTVNVAFTAKAAQEIASASGRPAYTVDAFLNAYARGDVRLQGREEVAPRGEYGREEILIPDGAQFVLRVDEVSFVGAKQARHLLQVVKDLQEQGVQAKLQLIGDTRQMQAIQSGDLFRQVLELGREGWADVAHLDEIRRQRDPEFLEITTTLNRDDRLPGENAREALSGLQKQGKVFELERREELVSAAVERYRAESAKMCHDLGKAAAGEKQSVLLIVSTNADRNELNCAIREQRVAAGEIEEGKRYRVLTPVAQGVTADSYRIGDEIHFSGYRGDDGKMQRWAARLNTVGMVTAIDATRDRVAVTYSFTAKDKGGARVEKTVTKTLPAAEMIGKTTVYRGEQRNFSTGDRIITLKNDREVGVQNGLMGVVKNLDEDGRAVVRFGAKEITLDLARYRHVDHAYAVTIHKSQGATVEHSILFAPVLKREEKTPGADLVTRHAESYGRSSYNALNVAITRAQYGACVFTNSVPDLMREVQHVDVKSSTLNPIPSRDERTPPLAPVSERKYDAVTAPSRVPILLHPRHHVLTVRGGRTVSPHSPEKTGSPGAAPAFGKATFDAGAKLGKRLDELDRVRRAGLSPPHDIMPKLAPSFPAPGKEIAKQLEPVPVKGINLDLGKR